MTRSRRLAAATATVLVLLLVVSTAAGQQSKFHSSQETGGAPGRYRVEVELRPGDDLVAISGQLAATYGARMEPYAEEGFFGFAIMATPARARLMSSDPRVVAITDLNPPSRPAEPVAAIQPRTASPVAEQVRTVLRSEAVPGLGTYSYDGSGNITSINDHVFRYDAFGRLQSALLGSFGSQAYTYDRYGNILKIVRNGDDTNAARMSVDPETNQMDLPFSPSNPANMIATYDGVGNVITHNGSFIYDALNMMKETTDTARRLHVYSASDERVVVVQVANGVETTSEWTLRDGSNRILRRYTRDIAGFWHWKEDYIYGGTRLLAAEVAASERVRHFHLDHLGTPRLITGNGGVRIAEKTYEPFGRKASTITDDFEQLEFTGHERDVPSLDYMHARYYQPDMGRFFSVDPSRKSFNPAVPQAWNRYSYAGNNPIAFFDPDGRDKKIFIAQSFAFDITRIDWASTKGRASNGYEVVPHRFGGQLTFDAVTGAAGATDFAILLGHGSATGMADQKFFSFNNSKKFNNTNIDGSTLATSVMSDEDFPSGIVLAGCNTQKPAQDLANFTGVPVVGTTGSMTTGMHYRAIDALVSYLSENGVLDQGAVDAMNNAACPLGDCTAAYTLLLVTN